ncbi:MAG TPA: alpha-hydroxy-acid oxidizing protein, partial [Xanthomonadales bacterium]|nr:alpha-hydroxy-acid oxidizing protein [Xanthomonadales bacterium]
MKNAINRPVTSADYRLLAARRLPLFLFNYIDGGANDERTMAANQADFQRYHLRQRVLRDVSQVDTRTVLSGQAASMPLALAPIGLAGMMARRGEAQAARAAARAGVPFTLSTVGICPLEEVQAAAAAPFWFQLYMVRDRELVTRLLRRAQAAGVETLLFTVDLPVGGMRHRDWRSGMVGNSLYVKLAKARQLATRPRWMLDVGLRGKPHDFGNLRE